MFRFIIFLSIIQMTARVMAQSFEFVYETTEDEFVCDVINDIAGNYYLVGQIGTFDFHLPNASFDGLIIKLSPQGDTIAILRHPANNSNYLRFERVLSRDDTSFIVLGSIRPFMGSNAVLYFAIADTSLNIVLEKTIPHNANADLIMMRAKKAMNDDILIASILRNYLISDEDAFFIRLNNSGDILTTFVLGTASSTEWGHDIIEKPDTSGYICITFGMPLPVFNPVFHHEFTVVNSFGVVDTIIEIPNSFIDIICNNVSDERFITYSRLPASGMVVDFTNSVKLYSINNLISCIDSVNLGKIDTVDNIAPNGLSFMDASIFFTGGTSNYGMTWFFSNQTSFYSLAKLDTNINLYWEKFYSYHNDYLFLWKVLATNDGGVLLAGTKYNAATANGQERDIYVIKLDSLGNYVTGTGSSPVAEVHDFIVYPNPATTQLTLQYSPPKTTGRAAIYNSLGETVQQLTLPTGTARQQLNMAHLPAGLYLIKVEADGKSGVKRFIKSDSR